MKKRQALLKLHLAVLLAGATGLFGRLLTLQEIPLVWYRILITTVLLIPILAFSGRLQKIPSRAALRIGGAGIFLGIHWVLFYASIRASNVSIGVLCYALIGFYTAILDPIVNKKRFDWKELVFSALTLLGLLLIYSFDSRYRAGIAIGALSSLFAAFFSMTTKKLTGIYDYPSSTFVLYEMIGGFICLTIALPFFLRAYAGTGPGASANMLPSLRDLALLLVLAGICTIGQYLLQFDALKEVSAFTVNLTYNLEPIYSIIFAMILFGEARELNFSFYLGLAIIISAVALQNLTVRRT
jgi:drug/metabolite transporter (DMT)-like permease